MRLKISRFIAILLLVIPGILATYGFLQMKDAVFIYFSEHGNANVSPDMQWGKLILGFLAFAAGVSFIGGWTFFRDRKRNYVAPRFKAKKSKRK